MTRRVAVPLGLTIAVTAALLPAAAANASAGIGTTWQTSISSMQTSWTDSSLSVRYDWDTVNYVVDSAVFTTSVNGTVVHTQNADDIDSDTESFSVPLSGTTPATVTIDATFCTHDEDHWSAPLTCAGGRVYTGTVLRIATPPKGKASAVALLDALSVRAESHRGSYARNKFKLWVDANRDGENTRAEVLKRESKRTVSQSAGRAVLSGRWISPYDNKVVTKASRLDIDHVVPLKEAWVSGGQSWSSDRRQAFANDLGYSPSLAVVTTQQNRSKGDREPGEWMPKSAAYACSYVKVWIAVKSRWKLSIDSAEKAFLTTALGSCANQFIAKPGRPSVSTLIEHPKKKPTSGSSSSGGGTAASHGLDPRYGTCRELLQHANHAPYRRGVDPEYNWYWDRDGDGLVCE